MLCCKTIAVDELAKPSGQWCSHCERSGGCGIYDTRPAGCREFYCEWMLSAQLGPEWKPDKAKFVLGVTENGHLSVGVDPGFPTAWRRAPYYDTLRQWARELAHSPWAKWPAVDVWIGMRCILILPDGETDLGVVRQGEEIVIDRTMTANGPVFVGSKLPAAGVAGPN
jgi:hypothetical protein